MIRRLLIALVLIGMSAQAHASSNGILTQGLSSSTSNLGGSTSLSALTSAIGANIFDSTLFAQTWNWNTLTTQTALTLNAPSATTGQALVLSPPLGVASGGTGAKQAGNSGIQNILGATAQLPNWNKALAKVISGKGNARILCLGDSTTMGLYSTNAASGNMKLLAPCGQLVNILNANGIDASYDGYIGFGLNSGDLVYDNRFSLGSGWSVSNSASSASLGGAFLIATGTTSSSAFLPTHPVDTFVIWYPTNPSFGGTLNYNIDGGSNTGIAENGTTSYSHTTVSTTLGFHTINFNYGSGGNAWVSAIEAYDSTKSQVIVDNAGWDTASTANWALNTGAGL
jgi:hypothetical protein